MVRPSKFEANNRDALAAVLGGRVEVWVEDCGRPDIITADRVIEVKRRSQWKEAIGKALVYGLGTGLQPTVALLGSPGRLRERIVSTCHALGVDVIWGLPELEQLDDMVRLDK